MSNTMRRLLVTVIFSIVLGLLTLYPAYAVVGPVTGEFQVNSPNAVVDETSDLAMDSGGDWVVVWHSLTSSPDGDLYFQRYDAAGAAQGSETLVNVTTSQDQRHPQIAMNRSNGSFVVVWESDTDLTAGINHDVYARLFDASGAALTGEIAVNTTTGGEQTNPQVAMNASSNFVVAWQSPGDSSGTGIYFQRFDSAGTAQGSETQANANTANGQTAPTVGLDSSGNFVIAWVDGSTNPATPDIALRKFNSSGAALTGDVPVDSSAGTQGNPSIAMRGTGDLVLAWDSNAATPDAQIYARRYNSALTPQGAMFLVNSNTTVANVSPDCAMNSTGEFIISWEKNLGAGNNHIQGKRYDASGSALGSEFQVDTSGTKGRTEAAAGIGDQSQFAFSWSADSDIFARLYGDRADLVLTKTSDVPAFSPLSGVYVPGSPIQYTLTVTNSGPSDVVGAAVADTFTVAHTGVTWTCVANGSASCVSGSPSGTGASGSGDISQPVDITAGGGSVVFTATANTAAGATANLTNSASVSAPAATTEVNPANNTASLDLPAQIMATQLAFGQQPTNTLAGATITPAVTVELRAADNTLVTGDNTTPVTLAIGTNPSGGTLSGTLTVTAVNGVAIFNNLSINNAGNGYTLVASATGLTGATSSPFDVIAVIVPTPPVVKTPGVNPPALVGFDPALSKRGILQPGGLGLPGEKITWEITLTNRGNAAGQNVVVSDTIHPELRIDSTDISRGSASVQGQVVTFTVSTLNPGETVIMHIVTTVLSNPAAGGLINRACLNASNANPVCADAPAVLPPTTLPKTGYGDPAQSNSRLPFVVGLGLLLMAGAAGFLLRRRTN